MADPRRTVSPLRRPGAPGALARATAAGLLALPYALVGIMTSLTVGKSIDPDYPLWTEVVFAVTTAAHTVLLVMLCVVNGRPLVQMTPMSARAARAGLVGAVGVAWLNILAIVAATVMGSRGADTLPFGGLVMNVPVMVLAWLTWRSARR